MGRGGFSKKSLFDRAPALSKTAKNSSGFGSSGGAASLMELKPFSENIWQNGST